VQGVQYLAYANKTCVLKKMDFSIKLIDKLYWFFIFILNNYSTHKIEFNAIHVNKDNFENNNNN
jgi:hypothetical protein